MEAVLHFAFWNGGEPNNFENRNEDYAHITAIGVGTTGSWNDLTNTGVLLEIINLKDIL
jgi:hypothetical protein